MPLHCVVTLVAVTLMHLTVFYGFHARNFVKHKPIPTGVEPVFIRLVPIALGKLEEEVEPALPASNSPVLETRTAAPKTPPRAVKEQDVKIQPKSYAVLSIQSDKNAAAETVIIAPPKKEQRRDKPNTRYQDESLDSTINARRVIGSGFIERPTDQADKKPSEKDSVDVIAPNKPNWILDRNDPTDLIGNLQRASCRQQALSVDLTQDKAPRPCSDYIVEYPVDFHKEGFCRYSFKVSPKGRLHDITVISCNHSIYEKITFKALQGWYYIPEVKAGKRVESDVIESGVTYSFIDKVNVPIKE